MEAFNGSRLRTRPSFDAAFDEPTAPIRLEASVSSLYYGETVAPRLNETFPGCRVIVILRDPVARAISNHAYLVSRGLETNLEFSAALLDRDLDGLSHIWDYIGLSRYSRQLAAYEELFQGRLLVLMNERDLKKPDSLRTMLSAFLETDLKDFNLPSSRNSSQGSGGRKARVFERAGSSAIGRAAKSRLPQSRIDQLRHVLLSGPNRQIVDPNFVRWLANDFEEEYRLGARIFGKRLVTDSWTTQHLT